jgi:hypothetical protein
MELKQIKTLLEISHSEAIMRRYFVVNGFDGALTMLGLIMGFYVSDRIDLAVVITSCLAAALALGMSGVSSAYISEAAERRRDLAQLEKAMGTSLNESHHAQAARWIPWLVALVNGIAPLLIALRPATYCPDHHRTAVARPRWHGAGARTSARGNGRGAGDHLPPRRLPRSRRRYLLALERSAESSGSIGDGGIDLSH